MPAEALAPAAAYFEVEALVPALYFRTPTPDVGVVLAIQGDDNVPTHWAFDEQLAHEVARTLARRRNGARVVSSIPYDNRNAGEPF